MDEVEVKGLSNQPSQKEERYSPGEQRKSKEDILKSESKQKVEVNSMTQQDEVVKEPTPRLSKQVGASRKCKFYQAGSITLLAFIIVALLGATIQLCLQIKNCNKCLAPVSELKFNCFVEISDLQFEDEKESLIGFYAFKKHLVRFVEWNVGALFIYDKHSVIRQENMSYLVKETRKLGISLYYVKINESEDITERINEGYNGIVLTGDIRKVSISYLNSTYLIVNKVKHPIHGKLIFIQDSNAEITYNDELIKKFALIDHFVLKFPIAAEDFERISAIVKNQQVMFSERDLHNLELDEEQTRRQAIERVFISFNSGGLLLYGCKNLHRFKMIGDIIGRSDFINPFEVKTKGLSKYFGNTTISMDTNGNQIFARVSNNENKSKYHKVSIYYTVEKSGTINFDPSVSSDSKYFIYSLDSEKVDTGEVGSSRTLNLEPYSMLILKEGKKIE